MNQGNNKTETRKKKHRSTQQRKRKKKKIRGIPSNFRADNDSKPVNDELVHTDSVNIGHVNNESLVVNDINEPNQMQTTSEVTNITQTDKKGVESSSRKNNTKIRFEKTQANMVNTDNLLTGVQKNGKTVLS